MNSKTRAQQGFTIIELLTVIIVISILAGITVVSYVGWRERTTAAVLKNDLMTISAAMKRELQFNNAYPLSLPSAYTPSQDVSALWQSGGTPTTYCVEATSGGITYHIRHTDSEPQNGAC